jgi:hypothetical protein
VLPDRFYQYRRENLNQIVTSYSTIPYIMSSHKDTIASEVLSASLGGAVSASILYPLEVLKTKMQASDDEEDENKGMIEYATDLYKKEGFQVYLNGIETSAFQSAMEKAFYFFAYTALKQVHQVLRTIVSPSTANRPLGASANLFLGCLAGKSQPLHTFT